MRRGCKVRIRNGYRAVKEALENYVREIYHYNALISGTGYYLKPVHIVTKRLEDGSRLRYVYVGRYWWRLVYKKGRLRWQYIGREKPPELSSLPDPPTSPLQGLRVAVDGDDVIIDCKTLRRYKWVFAGYDISEV